MTAHRWIWLLLAAWIVTMALSVLSLTAEPTGDGFVRGLNRVTGFLGWQLAGAALSLVLWLRAGRLPREDLARWAGRGPAIWSLLLGLLFVGLIVYSAWIGRA